MFLIHILFMDIHTTHRLYLSHQIFYLSNIHLNHPHYHHRTDMIFWLLDRHENQQTYGKMVAAMD